MKREFYLLSLVALSLTACDPLEDVYNQVDAQSTPYTNKTDVEFTLTAPEHHNKSHYATEEEAYEKLPAIINNKYPLLDNGSGATVTYNLLSYSYNNNIAPFKESYILQNSDYGMGGATFANFDRWSQIETFLKTKYPSAVEGSLVTLTFTWFSNNMSPTSKVITDSYYYKGGQWYDAYHVSVADYLSIDRNRNNAFAPADAPLLPDYFNKFLKQNLVGAKVGDVQYVSYLVRESASSTPSYVMAMVYDGNNWSKVSANILTTATAKFSKKNGTWIPDLTIKYALTADNYVWIADNSTAGTADNRANLKSFKNFFQDPNAASTDTRLWTDAQIHAALADLLKNLYPNVDEGQKIQVTYIAYRRPNATIQTTFEKDASGNFVVVP